MVILDGGADAGDVVQFAADGGTEGDFTWDKVPAGRRVGCGRLCGEPMFGDESFALRETVRMGGGDARFGWIGSLRPVASSTD